jgi:hypothetical protein
MSEAVLLMLAPAPPSAVRATVRRANDRCPGKELVAAPTLRGSTAKARTAKRYLTDQRAPIATLA